MIFFGPACVADLREFLSLGWCPFLVSSFGSFLVPALGPDVRNANSRGLLQVPEVEPKTVPKFVSFSQTPSRQMPDYSAILHLARGRQGLQLEPSPTLLRGTCISKPRFLHFLSPCFGPSFGNRTMEQAAAKIIFKTPLRRCPLLQCPACHATLNSHLVPL